MLIDYKLYSRKSWTNERLFYLKATDLYNPALKRYRLSNIFIVKDIENLESLLLQPLNINLYTLLDYKEFESLYLELIKINADEELLEDFERILFTWE